MLSTYNLKLYRVLFFYSREECIIHVSSLCNKGRDKKKEKNKRKYSFHILKT